MLSILIPVYNYDVRPLVTELQRQCANCAIEYEILAQDDASMSEYNSDNYSVNSILNCNFVSLEQNVAHRENRNLLAKRAKYDTLLFIDGDSICINPNYIANYLENIIHFDIVYGGRIHPEFCPSENQKLRWLYGIKREDKRAIDRIKKPFQNLLFNNTLIKKNVFATVGFDLTLKKYGHDDTQLSFELSKKKYTVKHIDNQISHGDIDFNEEYLKKTTEALQNLKLLYTQSQVHYNFVPLLKIYRNLRILKLHYLVRVAFKVFEKQLQKNFHGNKPNMQLFSLYKLGYLCSLDSIN